MPKNVCGTAGDKPASGADYRCRRDDQLAAATNEKKSRDRGPEKNDIQEGVFREEF
jgi:hypothetical protein